MNKFKQVDKQFCYFNELNRTELLNLLQGSKSLLFPTNEADLFNKVFHLQLSQPFRFDCTASRNGAQTEKENLLVRVSYLRDIIEINNLPRSQTIALHLAPLRSCSVILKLFYIRISLACDSLVCNSLTCGSLVLGSWGFCSY